MKRALMVLAAFLLLFLGAYLVWLFSARYQESPRVTEFRAQAQQLQSKTKVAPDSVPSDLLNLWSRPVTGKAVISDGRSVVAWRAAFGSLKWLENPSQNLKDNPRAKDDFKALRAALLEAFSTDEFPVQNETDFSELRRLCRALLQDAAERAEEGTFESSLENVSACLKLASNLSQVPRFEREASSLVLRQDALLALGQAFPPSAELRPEQWMTLAELCWSAEPRAQGFSLALAQVLNETEKGVFPPRALEKQLADLNTWFALPGVKSREQRILLRELAFAIESWNQGRVPTRPIWSAELTIAGLLSGRYGLTTNLLIPPYWSLARWNKNVQSQSVGLGLAFALCAFRETHGHLPKELSDLRKLNLQLPPKDLIQELGVVYSNLDESQVQLRASYLGETSPSLKPVWLEFSKSELQFHLNAVKKGSDV